MLVHYAIRLIPTTAASRSSVRAWRNGLSVLLLFGWQTGNAATPAFPGAQGFGAYATGGRGGTVYHVTNLNDSGPGSFRDAVSVSGRTVVFDVGGVISYLPPRYAPKPNITIAGQTAPGDGITLYGNGLSFSGSHNNICRFIRVRQGINGDSDTDAMGIANGHDMIFDHMSISWGRDETFSVSGNITNITIQSSIIAQGLQGHSAGGLIQTDGGVSILRCLYIDNDTRNPKVKGINEYVNNVVYGWETAGYIMGGDSAGESFANAFNNYFINGPAGGGPAFSGGNTDFHIHASNNWQDSNRNGVLDGSTIPLGNYGSMDWQATPYAYPVTNAFPALTALKWAISDAGAAQKRDTVDERLMTELTSYGTLGQTITSELLPPMSGPGIVKNGILMTDTDQDGMPDYWELINGSPVALANNNDPSSGGYTKLEDYLNWLAVPHAVVPTNLTVGIDLRTVTRGFTNRNPVYSFFNVTNGSAVLVNGRLVQFTPTNAPALAGFDFSLLDTDGSTITQSVRLAFTSLAPLPSNVVWRGDGVLNSWDLTGSLNWSDGQLVQVAFENGKNVVFDDGGSTSPEVQLSGALQPATLTFNSTKNFTLSGSGSLAGGMGLDKTNTGSLIINTTNQFSGNTVVSYGILLVHGSLDQSAVTVRSPGTIGGRGRLGNGLIVHAGGTLSPGNGTASPGALIVTNALTESGGAINRFDLSDDPSGAVKTNDLITIDGNLNVSGVNSILVNLLDGPLADGHYVLFEYTGALNGALTNFTVIGANGVLTNPPGQIALHVDNTRPPANLVWLGNGISNTWDNGTSANWLNGTNQDRFYFLDDVVFNDSGSSIPPVNLNGSLSPASVLVDAMNNYSFIGSGKVSGTTGLTKTNSGTLTILTTNDFTGSVVIGGGVLAVSRLTNAGLASSLGAGSVSPAGLIFYGSTLRYLGNSVNCDRGATFNSSGATFDITNSSTTLTWNGTNQGAGGLKKIGPGTLTLTAANSFSGGTVISNGTLALFGPAGGATTTANNYSLGSGNVTFFGGTLKLFGGGLGDAGAGYGNFSRPMFVATGQVGTVLTPARYTMSSSLSGGGTLNLEVNYVRGALSGNWSAFTGLINVTARTLTGGSNEFRVNNSSGYPNATIFLNDNVVIDRSGGATTIVIGALGGTAGSWVGPGNQSSSGTTYSVGWNNADATFNGTIKNDGTTTLIKVGTGKWILTGANTWSGGFTISNGTVLANNISGSAFGSGPVTVHNGGRVGGTGFIGASLTINAGGTLAPGTSVGTFTINNTLVLASGALLSFELGPTNASDKVVVNGGLTLGGTLNISNVAGFGPGVYTLFTYSGALGGTVPLIGAKPAGLAYGIITNTPGQIRLSVQPQSAPSFSSIYLSGGFASFSGLGGPTGTPFYVLSSTNLSHPLLNWSRLATNQFDGTGGFNFSNSINPAEPQRFYLLQLP